MANPSPAITFRVDLSLLKQETFGPVTNQRSESVLHPDSGTTQNTEEYKAYRPAQKVTWLGGFSAADNVEMKHGAEFTAYGPQAIYLRKTYGIGIEGVPADRAVLEIVSVA